MDPKDFSIYDSEQVRVVPFPEAEACGDGWWRIAWNVETTPVGAIKGFAAAATIK